MLCVCVCACLCTRTAAAYKQRAAREKKPTRTFYLFLDSADVFGVRGAWWWWWWWWLTFFCVYIPCACACVDRYVGIRGNFRLVLRFVFRRTDRSWPSVRRQYPSGLNARVEVRLFYSCFYFTLAVFACKTSPRFITQESSTLLDN